MNQSPSIAALNKAFVAAQNEIPQVHKTNDAKIPTKAGGSYSYKYADLADVLKAVIPVITKHGLSIRQGFVDGKLQTELHHESGEFTSDDGLPLPTHLSPQELGSAITYFRRYGALAILGVAPEEDDDGKGATDAHKKPQANGKAPQTISDAVVPKLITAPEAEAFRAACADNNISRDAVLAAFKAKGISSSAKIPASDYQQWMEWARLESEVPA